MTAHSCLLFPQVPPAGDQNQNLWFNLWMQNPWIQRVSSTGGVEASGQIQVWRVANILLTGLCGTRPVIQSLLLPSPESRISPCLSGLT